MDGDGFDPCECIWSQQAAMRRLVALLRQSQSYCTDNECFLEPPGPQADSEQNFFLMTFLAIAVLFFLVVFRPPSLRDSPESAKQHRDNEPDDSVPPPLC